MANFIKILKCFMIVFFSSIVIAVAIAFLYLQHPQFGKAPKGKRLERIKQSLNYKDGKFQNFSYTPELTEGHSMLEVVYNHFFKKAPRRNPTDTIPAIKTDLLNLSVDQDILVWFGHSSYFVQLDGKRILVDPIFSGNASPIPGTNKSFNGTKRIFIAR